MSALSSSEEQSIQKHLTNIGYLGESRLRSWVKSIVWRLTGIAILATIGWLITHSWQETTLITAIFHFIRVILYYFHERAWEHISWGRIKAKGR